jgi:tetratricopeptide (TPR) repeat protein
LSQINTLKAENKRLREAMATQQRNLKKYAEEYYQMGNDCVTQAHNNRAAIANYDKALEMCPTMVDAWVRKGVTLFNDGNDLEAERCLNEAVRLSPGHFKALFNRGQVRLQQGHLEEAVADFDRATSLKPENARAHELFGDTLMRLGKEQEAGLQWAIAEQLRRKKPKKD